MCNMYNASTFSNSNGYGCSSYYNNSCNSNWAWGSQRICRDCNGNIWVRTGSNGCGCSCGCSSCCNCGCNSCSSNGNSTDANTNGNGNGNGDGSFACVTFCGDYASNLLQTSTATSGSGSYSRSCRCRRWNCGS